MRWFVTIVVLFLGSCASPERNILKYPLASGGTVGQNLPSRSPAVVLLIDPADIVVCGNHISRWLEWDRRNPGQLAIILTEPPTPDARRQLLLFRIRADGVLRRSRGFERVPTPYEYLVSHGRVVLSEQVPAGTPESPLLKAFERGQVAALLKSDNAHLQ
jgi:hypothetical protein